MFRLCHVGNGSRAAVEASATLSPVPPKSRLTAPACPLRTKCLTNRSLRERVVFQSTPKRVWVLPLANLRFSRKCRGRLHNFRRAVPNTPADRTVARVDSSPSARPSSFSRRVGVRTFTFEACSGFTHITARRIARPPKAAFVTRLRLDSYPSESLVSYQTYRQLSGWNPPPLVKRAIEAHGKVGLT